MGRIFILLRQEVDLAMLSVRIIVGLTRQKTTAKHNGYTHQCKCYATIIGGKIPKDCRTEINNILVRKIKSHLISSGA